VGVQQRVEIIKALYRNANLLILDEPTAVLTPSESKELFQILRRLTSEGHSIIFISHKLAEVMEVSDRVTILRDGRVVGTVNTKDTNEHDLAHMMVGREVNLEFDKPAIKKGQPVLEVNDLHARNNRDLPALKGISFTIHEGEIFGLAGIDGNGQLELTEVLLGFRKATEGRVCIAGKDALGRSPREIIELDVAQIPEDRHTAGLILDFSIAENLILKRFSDRSLCKGFLLDSRTIQQHSRELIHDYDIRCPGCATQARNLSGGNQQKVILARELCRAPRLIIAVHPTRGLDVGATEFVLHRLIEHRERGAAILFISAELQEILTLSDRIGVIFGGQLLDIVDAEKADLMTLGRMMGGVREASGTKGGSGVNSRVEGVSSERDASAQAD
jgi:general nucleoside transport system ATP-binding protein